MVDRLAQKCSNYMIGIGAADPKNDIALTYGILQIFSSILHILLLVVASIITGLIGEIVAFSLAFYTLKIYFGGVHTKRHWQCLILFTLMGLFGGAIGHFLSVPALAVSLSIGVSGQMYNICLDYLCGLTDDPISYKRENCIAISSKCPDHIREQLEELVTSLNTYFSDK